MVDYLRLVPIRSIKEYKVLFTEDDYRLIIRANINSEYNLKSVMTRNVERYLEIKLERTIVNELVVDLNWLDDYNVITILLDEFYAVEIESEIENCIKSYLDFWKTGNAFNHELLRK